MLFGKLPFTGKDRHIDAGAVAFGVGRGNAATAAHSMSDIRNVALSIVVLWGPSSVDSLVCSM